MLEIFRCGPTPKFSDSAFSILVPWLRTGHSTSRLKGWSLVCVNCLMKQTSNPLNLLIQIRLSISRFESFGLHYVCYYLTSSWEGPISILEPWNHGIDVFHAWNQRPSADLAHDKIQMKPTNKERWYPVRHTSFWTKVSNCAQSPSVHSHKLETMSNGHATWSWRSWNLIVAGLQRSLEVTILGQNFRPEAVFWDLGLPGPGLPQVNWLFNMNPANGMNPGTYFLVVGQAWSQH
jgi:hypothetical protein